MTEGEAARLEVAVRKQVRKKICFSLYGNTALCTIKDTESQKGPTGRWLARM